MNNRERAKELINVFDENSVKWFYQHMSDCEFASWVGQTLTFLHLLTGGQNYKLKHK